MNQAATVIATLFFLALFEQSFLERIAATVLGLKGEVMIWTSLAVGVLLAVAFSFDATAALGLPTPVMPLVGQIVTGLAIGSGSNFLHQFVPNSTPSAN